MSQNDGSVVPLLPQGPRLSLLHAAMLLSGFGTVFLGPALPSLTATAHASDSGSGLFFTAQFIGAFLGGVTTSRRVWLCLLRGLIAATLGFAALATTSAAGASLVSVACALAVMGFGVGQMLTSVNLLVSRRFQHGRSSALSLINFSWSFGALTAPFLLGLSLSMFSLRSVLGCTAAVFLLVLLATAWDSRGQVEHPQTDTGDIAVGLPTRAFALFGAMLLLYGGVETCLTGWITTFATRYAGASLKQASLCATALWIGITAGRAASPMLLRAVRERVLILASLILSTGIVLAISRVSQPFVLTLLAGLLGLSLAPWFPMVLSLLLGRGASARQTGTIIAVSGIGAAVLPAILGEVAHASGSLRTALIVPVAGLAALIALALFPDRTQRVQSV